MPFDRSGDEIAAMLRTTGPRPPVPSDLSARVEARVRAHWEADTHARRLWRRWSAGAAVAAAIVIGVTASIVSPPAGTTPVMSTAATVEMVVDAAWSQSSNRSAAAVHRGDRLLAGTEIATENRGRVAMVLGGGQSLRLDANTRVTIISDRVIALDRGAVYVDSHTIDGPAAGSIEVRTPFGIIRDIGTQFEVRAQEGALSVRVREGRVVVDEKGTRIQVEAGQQLQRSSTGVVSTQPATDTNGFEWLTNVTPMIEIKDRTLQSFLEWAARERGLHLGFASAGGAAAARTIVLSGSIQGLTIDEALEAVLATSQMSPAVEGNVLRVLPSKESRGAR